MMCRTRPHTAVIRVYDEVSNVIETQEHAGDFSSFPDGQWAAVCRLGLLAVSEFSYVK